MRSASAKVMDEAIDLAIEGCSPYPERAAFIDADTASAGRDQARCRRRVAGRSRRSRRQLSGLDARSGSPVGLGRVPGDPWGNKWGNMPYRFQPIPT